MISLSKWFGGALASVDSGGRRHRSSRAPPPYGFWTTANGFEQLLITQSAQCSLADRNGRPTTSGSCSWNASYAGGILTIMSSKLYKPAPIYFNVVWVNQTTISVNGDIFYQRQ